MLQSKPVLLLRQTIKKFGDDNATHIAAAIAYYAFFSVFPLILAAISISGYFISASELEGEIIERVGAFLPASRELVSDTVRGVVESRGAVGVVAVLSLLWSGTAIFAAVRTGLNTAWGAKPRSFLWQKVTDFAMMLSLGALLLLSISATAAIGIVRQLNTAVPLIGPLGDVVLNVLAALIPATLTFGTLLLLYRLGPNVNVRWQNVWLGALVAAIGFEIAKNGFIFYIQNFASYNLVYGSLGGVVIFLFWAYISAVILLFGAEMAVVYSWVSGHASDIERAKPPPERIEVRASPLALIVGVSTFFVILLGVLSRAERLRDRPQHE